MTPAHFCPTYCVTFYCSKLTVRYFDQLSLYSAWTLFIANYAAQCTHKLNAMLRNVQQSSFRRDYISNGVESVYTLHAFIISRLQVILSLLSFGIALCSCRTTCNKFNLSVCSTLLMLDQTKSSKQLFQIDRLPP